MSFTRATAIFATWIATWIAVPAHASVCDVGGGNILSCGTLRNDSVPDDFFGEIGGLFDPDSYPGCGAGGDFGSPQETWIFTCAADGTVRVTVDQMECDLDVFVLNDSCDPNSSSSCLDASLNGSTNPDVVEFECVRGRVFYIPIERMEAGLIPSWVPFFGDECSIFDDHGYRIKADCFEECGDGFDNDQDGYIDCLDSDCPPCFEDCQNGKDDDFDQAVDCNDTDCIMRSYCCDVDNDGYWSSQGICGGDDCNDNPFTDGRLVNPGRAEIPGDNIDSNCDGLEDCFLDNDRDFYGVPIVVPSRVFSCFATGIAPNDDDCDDANATVNPAIGEVVANGRDDNCDGFEDCYLDQDGDTWGTSDIIQTSDYTCRSGRTATRFGDCDDQNNSVNPGAVDLPATGRDENCDGLEVCYLDGDNDGYGTFATVQSTIVSCIGLGVSVRNDDCNDASYPIHPNAVEIRADGIDQDCDGLEECWVDADRDQHGNSDGNFIGSPALQCDVPGVSDLDDDCDDSNPLIYPGAFDPPADGIDQDCNDLQDCFRDLDGDGWGGTQVVQSESGACIGVGISPKSGDCNDNNNAIYPQAVENANNGVDQDCDGFELCYQDQDGDTYGSTTVIQSSILTCVGPDVANNSQDCDDTPPDGFSIKPGGIEIPNNGLDENCDGFEYCYQDLDNDGFGRDVTILSASITCSVAGVSPNNLDCDDSAAGFRVNPSATETVADAIDQNCDGFELCYVDGDRDRFGVPFTQTSTDLRCQATGVSPRQDDCNDADPAIYPGAPPGPLGGVDYSCAGFTTCYRDADQDGYGSPVQVPSGDPLCNVVGMSINNDDCNDNNSAVKPGATETPMNGVDQDCDGFEMCYQDLDLDGFGTINLQPSTDLACNASGVSRTTSDCNDNPASNGARIYPGATEVPASDYDENCDGRELCYRDDDADDYGHATRTVLTTDITCQGGATYADNNLDCDDSSSLRRPGLLDTPANRIDEDCDGVDACYQDNDGDRFGSQVIVPGYDLTCTGFGVSQVGSDCFDVPPEGADVYPGATEIPGNGIDENCDSRELCYKDLDGDGYGVNLTVLDNNLLCQVAGLSRTNDDCNDVPAPGPGPEIHPGTTEIPADGVDQDCDRLELCYQDLDRDQHGTPITVTSGVLSCNGDGVSPLDDDCYDLPPAGASVYPGAIEIAGNGIDENCDGSEVCYVDADGDRFGRSTTTTSPTPDCSAVGVSPRSDDCNDNPGVGRNIYPGATETPVNNTDDDCDGKELCYQDGDGDAHGVPVLVASAQRTCVGVGVSILDDDCNDILPGGNFIYPGATEIPGNGVDENCDGAESCFIDNDGDGFGGASTVLTPAFDCDAPNATFIGGDCNDADRLTNPSAAEIPADGVDQDCDGVDDCYQDVDRDGFGSSVVIAGDDMTCIDPGESRENTDCLDFGTTNGVRASDINPGEDEVCNSVDDDCDGAIDDADPNLVSQFTWFRDQDGDGFGDDNVTQRVCAGPPGYTTRSGDCNDGAPAINPSAVEVCDPAGVDENCNDAVNEDDPGVQGTNIWHPDADRDGYGSDDPLAAIEACYAPPGFLEDDTDCDDRFANANPGEVELPYDGLDNDCDPTTLDDDLDRDGFDHTTDCNDNPGIGRDVNPRGIEGSVGNGIDEDCDGVVDDGTSWSDDDGDGWSEAGGDCNDGNANVRPGAVESANGVDDDCDGRVDEGTSRFDDDGDGWSENQGDCEDGNPVMNPGMTEIPDNGVDDDCDGTVDDGTVDLDEDGYTELGNDCAPEDPTTYPNAPELPDGVDNDCDGAIDEGTTATDDDGDGYAENQGDCNDADADQHPAAVEIGNGIDDDCDGAIDEVSENADDDGDGFAENQGDCDDGNTAVFPGADEVANGVDDDCDGLVDEGTVDADEDGFPASAGDCDDEDGWRNPDQVEVCDGRDNDCDGDVDEAPANCDDDVDTGGPNPPVTQGCCKNNTVDGHRVGLTAMALLVALRRRRQAA